MFERFTERARLSLFAARNHTSELGSPELGTEHLLYGVLHQDHDLLGGEIAERLRSRIRDIAVRGMTPKSDAPLTVEARRALKAADDISVAWHDRTIDLIHVLWGLAKENDTSAGRILAEEGITTRSIEAKMKSR